jgi:hypothetical protein
MSRAIMLSLCLVLAFAAASTAVPLRTLELAPAPERTFSPREDGCTLAYYNYCSGWVWHWYEYCSTWLWVREEYDPEGPQYGTCFDLADCPGTCRHLEEVWWAFEHFEGYGSVDVEIYCADDHCCPVGPPLAGYYEYDLGPGPWWVLLPFDALPLCDCEGQGASKFIVLITHNFTYSGAGNYWCPVFPASDVNSYNIDAGCETEWRCSSHSFVYRNAVDYCQVYGEPAPLWVSGADYGCTNYPVIPPGCHNQYYDTGYYSEWLIDCCITCQGPTRTQEHSWSQIRSLFR